MKQMNKLSVAFLFVAICSYLAGCFIVFREMRYLPIETYMIFIWPIAVLPWFIVMPIAGFVIIPLAIATIILHMDKKPILSLISFTLFCILMVLWCWLVLGFHD